MANQPPSLNSDNNLISTDNNSDNTPDVPHFITLGLLAKRFDEQEITIRRAFKKLVKKGKFFEGKDFIKADYINDRNFVYRINPDKFIDLVKQSDISTDNRLDNNLISLKEKYLKIEANLKTKDQNENDINLDNNLISTDNSSDNTSVISQEIIQILKESHQHIESNTKERIGDLKEVNKNIESELREKNIQLGKAQKFAVEQGRQIYDLHKRIEKKDQQLDETNNRVLYLQQQIHLLEKPKENTETQKAWWKLW
jgi:hypothetical protein